MFFRRLVAICLLVSYGIPTSFGPHWHHHSHGGCDHSLTCSTAADAHSQQNSCDCAFHRARTADSESSAESGLARRVSKELQLKHAHGDCVICAFYAQAQTASAALCELCTSELVVAAAHSDFSSVDGGHISAVARGPPASFIG